jgi:hypothetical protein
MIEAHYSIAVAGSRNWLERVDELRAIEDVHLLLDRLCDPRSDNAMLIHTHRQRLESGYPDHEVTVGVRGERGTILFTDNATGSWVTLGEGPPTSPTYAGIEFPTHCEIPVVDIAVAIAEFLKTGERPTCIPWQQVR